MQKFAALGPWTYATRVKVFSDCFVDSYHEGKAHDSHNIDPRGDANFLVSDALPPRYVQSIAEECI